MEYVRQIEGGNNRQIGDSHALMELVLMVAWQHVLTVCKRFGIARLLDFHNV